MTIQPPFVPLKSTARPKLLKIFVSLIYDGMLLSAVLFTATFLFIAVFGNATTAPLRYFLQIYLWLVTAAYFIWCWLHGGQTLAMQTWRIQLTDLTGQNLSLKSAILRYLLASLGLCFLGAGFLWAFFDREGAFLHDRLTGCQLRQK